MEIKELPKDLKMELFSYLDNSAIISLSGTDKDLHKMSKEELEERKAQKQADEISNQIIFRMFLFCANPGIISLKFKITNIKQLKEWFGVNLKLFEEISVNEDDKIVGSIELCDLHSYAKYWMPADQKIYATLFCTIGSSKYKLGKLKNTRQIQGAINKIYRGGATLKLMIDDEVTYTC